MTPEEVAAFFGTEAIVVEDEAGHETCTWAGCNVVDPLLILGADPWCLAHAEESALPRVVMNDGVGPCRQCGHGVAVGIVEEGVKIPMCPECRRNYKARRASGVVKKGAYARRRKSPGATVT